MCAIEKMTEEIWVNTHQCADYLQLCEEMRQAKDHFKEILHYLYSENDLDIVALEHHLIELSDRLNIGFPQCKTINLRNRC